MRCKSSENSMGKQKKGLWSPDEDQKLISYVMNHGHACWSSIPINAGLQRNGKSCRLRWVNYLRPGLRRGAFTSHEEETILTLHGLIGNKWSQISKHLHGRTDNEIKNYWHSRLKKKVAKSELHPEVRPIGDDKNSNLLHKESSSSCLTTSKSTNSLFSDMDQSVPPVSRSSHLPKVLFADWISLDQFQHEFGMSSDKPLSHASNYQQGTAEHEWQCNEGSAASYENTNCVNSYSNEDAVHTEMTIDQIFNINVEDFDIDDIMYM